MAINFPTSLDSFPNPTSTDLLENATAALDHDVQHANANDALEALEAKVGVDGSAVTTSHDYKLSAITGSAKALTSGTSTQSVTDLTLTTPQINFGSDANGDLIYRNGSGVTARLPIGSTDQILAVQSGLPTWIANPSAADASTTAKGIVEEATLAETLARTSTGGTSAKLFVSPVNLTTVMTYDYIADAVGTDAYAISVTPAPTAYVAGQTFTFKAGTANTGTCSLNVNSLGAKTIKKNYNSDLVTGDILANQIVQVCYDGTNMQMVSPSAQPALFATGQTTATGTGDVTIAHGLGITPKLVRMTAVGRATSNSQNGISVGTATTASNESSVYTAGTGATIGTDATNIISVDSGTGSEAMTATLSTLDSTNIVLNFGTFSGGGTCYILWEAYA